MRRTYEELLQMFAPAVGVDEIASALEQMVEENMVTRVVENGDVFYYLTEENERVAVEALA